MNIQPDLLFCMCLQSGPDFAGGGFERALAAISRRRDGHIIIKRLIETVGVDGLQDYAKYMLEAAVEDGLAATVEVCIIVSVVRTKVISNDRNAYIYI